MSFVGRALRGVRAGEQGLLWNSEAGKHAPASIQLVSDAFDSGASIPRRHAVTAWEKTCPHHWRGGTCHATRPSSRW